MPRIRFHQLAISSSRFDLPSRATASLYPDGSSFHNSPSFYLKEFVP